MWFEIILVLILFPFKNISGIRVVHEQSIIPTSSHSKKSTNKRRHCYDENEKTTAANI